MPEDNFSFQDHSGLLLAGAIAKWDLDTYEEFLKRCRDEEVDIPAGHQDFHDFKHRLNEDKIDSEEAIEMFEKFF